GGLGGLGGLVGADASRGRSASSSTLVNARDLGPPPESDALAMDLSGDAFHEVRAELYDYERAFLAELERHRDAEDSRPLLGATLALFEAFGERRVASRPGLEAVASLLDHPDRRVGVTAAACLGA